MPSSIIHVGDRFGRLIVIGDAPRTPTQPEKLRFWCACDCGGPNSPKNIGYQELRQGKTFSCGCLNKELSAERRTTHGACAKTNGEEDGKYDPIYNLWIGIKNRCYNQDNHMYHRYGGRGIKVWDGWVNNFAAFKEYMGPKPTPKHEIDRFPDNNGDYKPGNVRWATRRENMGNRNNTIMVEYRGQQRVLADLCVELGFKYATIADRRRAGATGEELFRPLDHPGKPQKKG